MNQLQKKASESYTVAIILAFVGGFLDVYTYVCRGGVFANAQTGNIVLLAIHASKREWAQVGMYALPIFAFMLGILVTEFVKVHYRRTHHFHWRQIVIGLEFLVLCTIAFVPSGKYDDFVNIAVSFVCSMQVESFRTFEGNGFATTMCTGNLRSATELLFYSSVNKDERARRRSLQYYGIICVFILGAICSMQVTQTYQEQSVLFLCILLAVVFALMFIPMEEESSQKKK
ncbi:MAG: YoaK family protein [Lachnospiraceae bacterium]|uniref:YoaK family protein n=1 Tax=Parablautia sp. Marseille-Q6255 TaxID=3039593 RepID=UPI0024BCBD83|nr:YoaK family protein [Parablautia sp. Marseille-Q6255]